MSAFLTFVTPTYRRPRQLAACMASVASQTAVDRIEHVVLPDYVGRGIDGMYASLPLYASSAHGEYVHLLADDDILAGPDVVARLDLSLGATRPPVVLVPVLKAGQSLPSGPVWPPVCGQIDLGCLVVRSDVWKAHVGYYGRRYEGDYDFAAALAASGHGATFIPGLFLIGAVSRGQAEAA